MPIFVPPPPGQCLNGERTFPLHFPHLQVSARWSEEAESSEMLAPSVWHVHFSLGANVYTQ